MSISSGIADSVLPLVTILNAYLGLLFSTLVAYLRPPGPLLTVVVVMAELGELGRCNPPMASFQIDAQLCRRNQQLTRLD